MIQLILVWCYVVASNWCEPVVNHLYWFHWTFTPPNAPHRKLFVIKIHFRFKTCVDCGVKCTSVSALSRFSAPRCVGTEPGRSTMSFRSTLQPEDSADSDLSYRCINHKYLSDNPDKMQHSGSRHKHHQTLNTHHQQIPAKLTITWPTHTSATYITHNSHTHTHTSHITPKNSRHLSFFLAHKVGSVWCPLSFGWSAFVTRPSSVKIWRLGKLPDFGEGECDNFPSNTGQCELREHHQKKARKIKKEKMYTVTNRVFFCFVLDTVSIFNTRQWWCFMDGEVAYVLLLLLKLTLELPTPGCCGESFCHLTATFVRKQRIVGLFLLFEVGKQTESLGRV